jgi:hypothetical protein
MPLTACATEVLSAAYGWPANLALGFKHADWEKFIINK